MAAAQYSLGDFKFKAEEFLPVKLFNEITSTRVLKKEVIEQQAQARKRRKSLTKDGKLTILACDHPARLVLGVGDNPLRMGDRLEYVARVARVVTSPEFDGVMGTPDMIEDLFILDYLHTQAGGRSFLDEKVMVGCTNRGGLAGAVWELDDRMTAYTPETIARFGLDAAKCMFRLDLTDAGTVDTMEYCARLIDECDEMDVPTFIEPLPVGRSNGKLGVLKNANDLIKIIGVASALGGSSVNVWLKIPYCEDYARVARATSLPSLMLGGESRGDPTPIIREFGEGMKVGGSIRGALVGRNVLYPGDEDPLAVAVAINALVHEGADADRAIGKMADVRGRNIDFFAKTV
jgi:DhnA family fructose-bisphosphate aldolase class Ia